MQSKSRQYGEPGERYRYRYRVFVTETNHSVDYVDSAACRRLCTRMQKTWPSAHLQRIREHVEGEPGAERVVRREYQHERGGRWVEDVETNSNSYAKGAVFSGCGTYRYLLERHWTAGNGAVGFVMLNPSTADAYEDDPTIRRCVGFAKSWGFRSLYVANLFAWRATDPAILPKDIERAKGPRRDFFLRQLATQCHTVCAAWGNSLPGFADRSFLYSSLCEATDSIGSVAKCLGTTKSGQPRHPLYVRANQPLMDFHLQP